MSISISPNPYKSGCAFLMMKTCGRSTITGMTGNPEKDWKEAFNPLKHEDCEQFV